MLLGDLVSNTPNNHPDYYNLSAAVTQIKKVASYINEQKREFEHIQMEAELEAALGAKLYFKVIFFKSWFISKPLVYNCQKSKIREMGVIRGFVLLCIFGTHMPYMESP